MLSSFPPRAYTNSVVFYDSAVCPVGALFSAYCRCRLMQVHTQSWLRTKRDKVVRSQNRRYWNN